MLISVIVPVYNVEKFLPNCIESILHQSLKNIELILIDDGSSDGSALICDAYARKDGRIVAVHQTNQGQSQSRTNGIKIAHGDYIAFVDSDDFILPHFFEYLLNACASEKSEMAICGYVTCDEKATCADFVEQDCESVEVYSEDRMDEYFKPHRVSNTVWGKLYHRSIISDFSFPKRKFCEDVVSTYTMVHRSSSIAICEYKGYVYRNNSSSVMNEKYSAQKKDCIWVNVERTEFINNFYPHLLPNAYGGIVYSCNQVLLCMGRNKISKDDSLEEIQSLYRKYAKYYLRGMYSFSGKFFALVAFVNVRLGLLIARFL